MPEDAAVDTIMSWLNECSKTERLSFYGRSRVIDDVRRARRGGYYPIRYNNLHKENPDLYELIKEA